MDTTYEQALLSILQKVPPGRRENVVLSEAQGRILAEEVIAGIPLPPFDNSAMDGYAVHARDVAGARPDRPVPLRVIGRVAAGGSFAGPVPPGACVRIFTGSPMPSGPDAVVMQEETREGGSKPETVLVLNPVSPGEHVRPRGEDVKTGTLLAAKGERLSAGKVALLGAAGRGQVLVGCSPRVALLATGSELKEPGSLPEGEVEPLSPGAIYECNRAALAGLVRSWGGMPIRLPLVPDEMDATLSALATAFERCDLVVTSGGVSVGELDLVRQAIKKIGGTLGFWRVAIKPGRPFAFGSVSEKLFFGLPGNPVSALVTALLLVRPALLRWQGAEDVSPCTSFGRLAEPLSNHGSRRHFVRVCLRPDGTVFSAGKQASHMLKSLAQANGLMDMPPGATFHEGQQVEVWSWD